MEIPPELIRGCNSEQGRMVLADWVQDYGEEVLASELRSCSFPDLLCESINPHDNTEIGDGGSFCFGSGEGLWEPPHDNPGDGTGGGRCGYCHEDGDGEGHGMTEPYANVGYDGDGNVTAKDFPRDKYRFSGHELHGNGCGDGCTYGDENGDNDHPDWN